MDTLTTTTTTEPFLLIETVPARRVISPGAMLLGVLTGLVIVAVAVLTGACLVQLLEPGLAVRTSSGFVRIVAALGALLIGLVVPARMAWRAYHAHLRVNPLARPHHASSVLAWNLLLALSVVLFTPDLAKVSLREHGRWMVEGLSGSVPRAIDRGTRWVADRIPAQTVLTVTHHTTLPSWRDAPRDR